MVRILPWWLKAKQEQSPAETDGPGSPLLRRSHCHWQHGRRHGHPEATEEVNLFGTPEEVCDKIEALRDDFSTDEIMFEVNWTSSVPRDVVMTTIKCLTDKVIPNFK